MERFFRQKRILWLLIGLSGIVFFLAGKLFYLQLVQGPSLTRSAVQQRFQSIILLEGRGDIQDRHGRSLLDGRRSIGLLAFPAQYRGSEEEIIHRLSSVNGIEKISSPPYGPLPFWVTPTLKQDVHTPLPTLPGLILASRVQRYGPDALARHAVGYLKESDGRGVSGIELSFDRELSAGQKTVLAALVDGRSRLIPGLGYRMRKEEPEAKNVVLAIDGDLQREVERIMNRRIRQGAVVVMDPWNGDILAMASRPDFNPGDLGGSLLQEYESFLNRALWEFQPGSVFKVVAAAAALKEGKAGLFQTYRCPGGITVGGLFFACSNLHQKQEITMVEAFAHSCNSYFINLALELGPETVAAYARRFGFGEVTGLPVGEKPGSLPAAADLSNPRAQANTAIGQGAVLATPLQVAAMFSVIANGGHKIQPRLVLALTDRYGREFRRFLPRRGQVLLSPVTVSQLKYLLMAVMEEGTGRRGNTTAAPAGAKTGTAESGRRRDGREVLNHWIAGFYPIEQAGAVIAVFADDLLEGTVSDVFGEITRYLERR